MLTRFEYTASRTVDVQARRWRMCSPSGRTFSDVELWVPRTSPAFSSSYIRKDGGSYIRIDDRYLGTFEGVTQPIQDEQGGIIVRAYHLGWWLSRRVVSRHRVFQ